jgi:hypothetical protein
LRSAIICARSARKPFGRFFHRALRAGGDDEARLGNRLGRLERGLELLPAFADFVHGRRVGAGIARGILQPDRERSLEDGAARAQRERVGFARLHADAEETFVGDADAAAGSGFDVEAQAIGRGFGDAAGGFEVHRAAGLALMHERPEGRGAGRAAVAAEAGIETVHVAPGAVAERVSFRRTRILEGAVADELGVQAAVHAVVDLLEENAVHPRIQARAGLRSINGDRGRVGARGGGAG